MTPQLQQAIKLLALSNLEIEAFLGDDRFQLEVRKLQQMDRLPQLRRHHQRLRLADIEAGPESHRPLPGYSAKLSPR